MRRYVAFALVLVVRPLLWTALWITASAFRSYPRRVFESEPRRTTHARRRRVASDAPLRSASGGAHDVLRASAERDDDKDDDDNVPLTPCNRVCRYNAECFDGRVCVGCFREAHEIGAWSSMTDRERYYCLADAADRTECVVLIDRFEGSVSRDELMRQARWWESRWRKSSKQ